MTPKPSTLIPNLLRRFDQHYPGNALMGAILLLKIDRETDNWISPAMGLCRRWRRSGLPSPWSHNVLITEPYDQDMSKIPILDCTIRAKDGTVDWNQKLSDSFGQPIDQQGGIYAGCVDEYCKTPVTLAGIKFLPDISDSQRKAIVAEGTKLYGKNYHYDIPGLFSELVRFISIEQIMFASTPGLLFCSAFCQAAYMNADKTFQFATAVPEKDFPAVPDYLTTDDDVWYSKFGKRFPISVPLPLKAGLRTANRAPTRRRGTKRPSSRSKARKKR